VVFVFIFSWHYILKAIAVRQFASLVCENLWNLWWKILKANALLICPYMPYVV
jgi:hypothetical protein